MSTIDLTRLVRARIAADTAARGHFRQIGGAAELAAAQRIIKTVPAVWVVPLSESAGSPLWAGGFRQKKELRVAIVIAAINVSDGTGAAALTGLALARSIIEEALIPDDTGWIPEGCSDVMAWAAGQLARIDDNGCLWWQDEYATTHLVKTPT
ncbi:MAG: hypothetical protein LBE22_07605 [Azoarcus sp.]|jgi:hypothetical protein|nr:hypothetical protein [Azoarcus sp.]